MKTLELIFILIILLGNGYLAMCLSIHWLNFYNKWKECKQGLIIWLVYLFLSFITIGFIIAKLITRVIL